MAEGEPAAMGGAGGLGTEFEEHKPKQMNQDDIAVKYRIPTRDILMAVRAARNFPKLVQKLGAKRLFRRADVVRFFKDWASDPANVQAAPATFQRGVIGGNLVEPSVRLGGERARESIRRKPTLGGAGDVVGKVLGGGRVADLQTLSIVDAAAGVARPIAGDRSIGQSCMI